MNVTPADVLAAANRIRPHILKTPLEASAQLGEACGAEVLLKLENLQRTGAFKPRGAFSRVTKMTPAEKARGIIAVSSGNHAQGVALAASVFGIDAVVVMPASTPAMKVNGARRLGANVRLAGANYDEAEAIGLEMAGETGRTYISPFQDEDVIAGQGTVGLEILLDRPDIDVIVTPAGGGGLMTGIGCIAKALNPRVLVYGVQAEVSGPWSRAFELGRVVRVPCPDSLADGITGQTTDEMYRLGRRWIDGIRVVSETEIADAMAWSIREHHTIIEGSAAVAVAALLNHKLDVNGKKVAVVISGANVDASRVHEILSGRV